jgi:hypothetical protein
MLGHHGPPSPWIKVGLPPEVEIRINCHTPLSWLK